MTQFFKITGDAQALLFDGTYGQAVDIVANQPEIASIDEASFTEGTPYNVRFIFTGASGADQDFYLVLNTGEEGTHVAILDGDSAEVCATKASACTLEGYIVEQDTATSIKVTSLTTGNTFVSVGRSDWSGAGIDEVTVKGTFLGGSQIAISAITLDDIAPGDISVYFNSADPVVITVEEGDDAGAVFNKIVSATPETHVSSNFADAAVIIEALTPKAWVEPILVDPGTTGITVGVVFSDAGLDSADTGRINVLNEQNRVATLYKDQYIVVINMVTLPPVEEQIIQVWEKVQFEKYFIAKGD